MRRHFKKRFTPYLLNLLLSFTLFPRQSKSLTQLEVLYVARCYHVWKESELLPWLESNVHRVLDRVEASDPLVEEWERYRQTRYPNTPKNILRHIILSDVKDIPILTSEVGNVNQCCMIDTH